MSKMSKSNQNISLQKTHNYTKMMMVLAGEGQTKSTSKLDFSSFQIT